MDELLLVLFHLDIFEMAGPQHHKIFENNVDLDYILMQLKLFVSLTEKTDSELEMRNVMMEIQSTQTVAQTE